MRSNTPFIWELSLACVTELTRLISGFSVAAGNQADLAVAAERIKVSYTGFCFSLAYFGISGDFFYVHAHR